MTRSAGASSLEHVILRIYLGAFFNSFLSVEQEWHTINECAQLPEIHLDKKSLLSRIAVPQYRSHLPSMRVMSSRARTYVMASIVNIRYVQGTVSVLERNSNKRKRS